MEEEDQKKRIILMEAEGYREWGVKNLSVSTVWQTATELGSAAVVAAGRDHRWNGEDHWIGR